MFDSARTYLDITTFLEEGVELSHCEEFDDCFGPSHFETDGADVFSNLANHWLLWSVVLCTTEQNLFLHVVQFVRDKQGQLHLVVRRCTEDGGMFDWDYYAHRLPCTQSSLERLRRKLEHAYLEREVIQARQDEAVTFEWQRVIRSEQLTPDQVHAARLELLRAHGLDDESVEKKRQSLRPKRAQFKYRLS
jgi:hypothetical protein